MDEAPSQLDGVEDDEATDEAVDPQTMATNRAVGERIREIRRQKRLSLHDVERLSEKEFKASVLGAYERGERALSVPRLQRLADFYGVPVTQLLPAKGLGAVAREIEDLETQRAEGASLPKVMLDLQAIAALDSPEGELLDRFAKLICVQRQDFNGEVLTLRRSDLAAVSVLLNVPVGVVVDRLEELGVCAIR